jgi:hypothetical protein
MNNHIAIPAIALLVRVFAAACIANPLTGRNTMAGGAWLGVCFR